MRIDERKKKIAYCEKGLADANRRMKRAMTSVKFWERKLKTQERALMQELEARVSAPVTDTGHERRFRND